jgi:hypothetical protein
MSSITVDEAVGGGTAMHAARAGDSHRSSVDAPVARMGRPVAAPHRFVRPALLGLAAVCAVAAVFLPLWGMTLVSVQYPEGLRMVVYPLRMTGDLREINMLNGYIGMAQISPEFFGELRVIAGLFVAAAVACGIALAVRRWWTSLLPLALLGATAVYGLVRMRTRLFEYGHNLDPRAPIEIAPFTPPMFGENMLAQFATYAYFSWGTMAAALAAVLVLLTLVLDVRARRAAR